MNWVGLSVEILLYPLYVLRKLFYFVNHFLLHSKCIKLHLSLRNFDMNKSSWLDDILPKALQKCAPKLAFILTGYFQSSYDKGIVSDGWKAALEQPVPK